MIHFNPTVTTQSNFTTSNCFITCGTPDRNSYDITCFLHFNAGMIQKDTVGYRNKADILPDTTMASLGPHV